MKKILLSVCALLAFACGALADDAFSVEDVSLPQNGEADVVVKFSLDEGSTCSGYTFWLKVPEQLAFVTYVRNDKTYVTYTAGDSYDETPTITPNIDDGYLKVGCITANSDPLNKLNGILVTFRLKIVGSVNVGDTFTGTLTSGTISAEGGTVHNVADATFTITIIGPTESRTVLDETSTVVPESTTGVDVRVMRTIKANEWSTICLPFAMNNAQVKAAFGNDVELGDFNDYEVSDDGESITVKFNDATSIEANHPYIIKVSEPMTEFTVDGVDIDPQEAVVDFGPNKRKPHQFVGTYVAGTVLDWGTLFLSGNQFWYSVGNTTMKAFRAYFNFFDLLPDFENNYESRNIRMVIDESTMGICENERMKSSQNEITYDLQGRRVMHARKGIYIENGKKVVK